MPFASNTFRVGAWEVFPRRNCLMRDGSSTYVEPKVMQVLLCLAERPSEVITRDELYASVWADTVVTDEVVTRAISTLRKALEDDFRKPTYIQTLPKVGYRLIASVTHTPTVESAPLAPTVATDVVQPQHAGIPVPSLALPLPWVIGALVVLFLIATGFIWHNTQPASASLPAHVHQRPATSLPGAEFDPALSPSGNQLAFVWLRQGTTDAYGLYVKDLSTDAIRLVGESEQAAFGPTWSPDGRHLAYIRFGAACDIMTVPASGGSARILGNCGANYMADLAWSPDGQALVYSDRLPEQQGFGLYQLSLGTRERELLTHTTEGTTHDTDPAFAPDGQQIAFIRRQNRTAQDVYVIDRQTRTTKRLTERGESIEGIAWTRDGTHVLFARNQHDNNSLWQVPVAGGTPRRVFTGNTGMRNPSLATSTARLVGEHWDSIINIWKAEATSAGWDIAPQPVIASTRTDKDVDVAADGSLVFVSDRAGRDDVWLRSPDKAPPTRLTYMNGAHVYQPRWSPDGRSIVFVAQVEGNADLYMIDRAGSLPHRLTTHTSRDEAPRWSADGHSIYFASWRSGESQVWKLSVAEGEVSTVQVTQEGGYAAHEAPDGTLYFTRAHDRSLWMRPARTTTPERLLASTTGLSPIHWTWTPEGLVLLKRTSSLRYTVLLHNVETRQTDTLLEATWLAGLTASPDGQSLYFSKYEQHESDIMLVDGLPL